MQTINDLLSTQTADQIRQALVTMLVTAGIRADLWRKGGSLSTILTVVAAFLAAFQRLTVQAIGFGFLPIATGGWLTLLAYYVYGVTRPEATFASGFVTLTNAGGGVYNYPVGQVTFLNSTTKQTYTNAVPLALGALSVVTIAVTAVNAGTASNAAPGQIDTLQTQLLDVTVSNAFSVLGLDAMSDADLRVLCTNKLGASSVRGPRNAYAYAVQVAVSPTTGAPVNINRTSVSVSSHTGTVTVYCASPSGAPTSDDLQGAINSIEQGVPGLSPPFSGARPDGVTALVFGATPVPYGPDMIVWAQAQQGLSAADLQAQVAAALSLFISLYPIGGLATDSQQGLFATGIDGVVKSVHPAIFAVQGPIDLPLTAGQVATYATPLSGIVVRLV